MTRITAPQPSVNIPFSSIPQEGFSFNVPAYMDPTTISNRGDITKGERVTSYKRGHAPSLEAKILPQGELVLKRWSELYFLLLKITGSPKWAEMLKTGLRLQAWRGYEFAGAKYLAKSAQASEKTWDRCLHWLREQRLVASWRLHRLNGEQSTNLLDLTLLWRLLLKLLSRSVRAMERVGSSLWVKIEGFWVKLSLDGDGGCL